MLVSIDAYVEIVQANQRTSALLRLGNTGRGRGTRPWRAARRPGGISRGGRGYANTQYVSYNSGSAQYTRGRRGWSGRGAAVYSRQATNTSSFRGVRLLSVIFCVLLSAVHSLNLLPHLAGTFYKKNNNNFNNFSDV